MSLAGLFLPLICLEFEVLEGLRNGKLYSSIREYHESKTTKCTTYHNIQTLATVVLVSARVTSIMELTFLLNSVHSGFA